MRVWHIVPAADEFMLEVMDFLEANSLQNNKKSSTARSAAVGSHA